MLAKLRIMAGLGAIAAVLVLQGCGKSDAPPAVSAAAPAGKPVVELAIAIDADTKPTTTFSADSPKLWAFFHSTGTKAGDKLRGVWTAEDVGDAAPKETKIDEAVLDATTANFSAAYSLSKPDNGFPVGKYRVDIYVNDQLSGTTKFSIE